MPIASVLVFKTRLSNTDLQLIVAAFKANISNQSLIQKTIRIEFLALLL